MELFFFIDNTIKWLTFCLANKEFQKYDWKKLKYNEICTIPFFFEKKFQIINL